MLKHVHLNFCRQVDKIDTLTRSLASKLTLELLLTQHIVDFFKIKFFFFFQQHKSSEGANVWVEFGGDAGAHKYTGHRYQPET